MKNVLITGGAGFIGSNYVRYALETHTDWNIVVLDKMTYAGNLDNLKDIAEHFKSRYTFTQTDIADREAIFECAPPTSTAGLLPFSSASPPTSASRRASRS